jgi:hypothetical protein
MGRIALDLGAPALSVEWLARAQAAVDANEPGPTGTEVAIAWADAEWALGRRDEARARIAARRERAAQDDERTSLDAWSRAHE